MKKQKESLLGVCVTVCVCVMMKAEDGCGGRGVALSSDDDLLLMVESAKKILRQPRFFSVP